MLFQPYFCLMEPNVEATDEMLSFEAFRTSVLEDYRIALLSRDVSLVGRREVLTGKAKFGIFGATRAWTNARACVVNWPKTLAGRTTMLPVSAR